VDGVTGAAGDAATTGTGAVNDVTTGVTDAVGGVTKGVTGTVDKLLGGGLLNCSASGGASSGLLGSVSINGTC
jgi:hypothetical protein